MAFLRVWPARERARCKRRVASAVKLRTRAGPIRHAGRAIAKKIYTRPAAQSRTLKACHGKRSDTEMQDEMRLRIERGRGQAALPDLSTSKR
jgi:hypothetical protein